MPAKQQAKPAAKAESAPWDRRKGESAKAYEAFLQYRDAHPKRSLRQVAQQRGCQPALVKRWSSQHAWPARAQAWDVAQAQEAERLRREQRQAAIAQQAEDAEHLRKLVRAFLKGLVQRDPETGELKLDASIKPRDAAVFYRLATDIEKSLPQPPEPEPDDGSEVLQALSTEELRAMLDYVREQIRREEAEEADEDAMEAAADKPAH